jgi:hypothetical protein
MHVRGQKLVRVNLQEFNSLQNSFPTSIQSIVGYITHHGDYPTQSNRSVAWPQCLHPALREAMTLITNREC